MKSSATLTSHAGIIRTAWRTRPVFSDFAIRESGVHRIGARGGLHAIEEDGSTSKGNGRSCRLTNISWDGLVYVYVRKIRKHAAEKRLAKH